MLQVFFNTVRIVIIVEVEDRVVDALVDGCVEMVAFVVGFSVDGILLVVIEELVSARVISP
jgi:hypothetical protein